jgi:dsRNA-specific ribonuclease
MHEKLHAEIIPVPPQVLFAIPVISRSLFLAFEYFPNKKMVRLLRIDRHWTRCVIPSLEEAIGYSPPKLARSQWHRLAMEALTHKSFVESMVYPQAMLHDVDPAEQKRHLKTHGVASLPCLDYEQLEKVGDAVVHVCVMWELFQASSELDGKALATNTAALASNKALRIKARLCDLSKFVR